MRDLVFKNLTSNDRRRKIIASSELVENDGVRTNICRHFLCRVLDIKKTESVLPKPILYIVKKRDTKLKTELFYCRIKGSMYLMYENTVYLIGFIHSLRINLRAAQIGAGN